LERLATTFEAGPESEAAPPVFGPAPGTPSVTLALAPGAQWILHHYPLEAKWQGDDGRAVACLAVSSPAWLERLLLRLGPDAEVVEASDPSLLDARSRAARRVLARYAR
jgi:proteasome accessory factor C